MKLMTNWNGRGRIFVKEKKYMQQAENFFLIFSLSGSLSLVQPSTMEICLIVHEIRENQVKKKREKQSIPPFPLVFPLNHNIAFWVVKKHWILPMK